MSTICPILWRLSSLYETWYTGGRRCLSRGRGPAVSAGRNRSCGLRADDMIACWGSDLVGRFTRRKVVSKVGLHEKSLRGVVNQVWSDIGSRFVSPCTSLNPE